jgi:acylphosphatase
MPLTMSKIRLQLLFVIALTLSGTVSAKCPTGSVTVHGRVDNLPSGAEVTVVLETPKGNVSKTASISNGEFTVEVSFSTWSSSFLGRDRCHNVPTVVEVKVVAAGKVYTQKRIPFKDSFEMYSPFLYRLKEDLFIDVLKETGSSLLRRPDGHSARG